MFTISAFDFDGTITRRDSLPLFIKHVVGRCRYYRLMLQMSPLILLAYLRIIGRSKVKERLLGKVLRRMPSTQFEQYADSFATYHADLLRPQALEAIHRAIELGHRVVIVTASLEEWVKPFFIDRRITVIGTRMAVENGQLSGRFATPNCIGAEKVRRLKQLIPPQSWARLIAYGDSRGDSELLAAADEPHYRQFRR